MIALLAHTCCRTKCQHILTGKIENDDVKVTMAIRDAAGSQRTQDDQVKEMFDAGCNVLCVNLADRTDPSEIIDSARERDVLQAEAIAKLAAGLVLGKEWKDIKFHNEKYVYLPYYKITSENVGKYLSAQTKRTGSE